jgi:transposase-like protein
MEKSSKRGKIPQSDWPLIMARYEAGETLASIARTYDCSPPAISYVVSRSRVRHPATLPPSAPGATEPQLIKTAATATGIARSPSAALPPASLPAATASLRSTSPATGQVWREDPPARPEAASASRDERREIAPREANGFPRDGAGRHEADLPAIAPPMAPRTAPNLPRPPLPAGQAIGDPRRTLHLSLGAAPLGNGGPHPAEPQPAERHNFGSYAQPAQPQTQAERAVAPANPGAPHSAGAPDRGHDSGAAGAGFAEAGSPADRGPVRRTDGNGAQRKEGGGSFIDKELRARVDGDIAAFLAAFDAALVEDSQESRSALREATDRLLRAGARTRIELERLEARMPLPPRDGGGRGEPAWRYR